MENTQRTQSLSTFMKISIAILTVVTLASISLLFIGDFEGKFERVFSTVTLFAIFVLLTAFDTRKDQKNEWYAPVALIANAYILGLILIVIWVTPFNQIALPFIILWKSLFVIATTRIVTFGLELLLAVGEGKPESLGRWGQVTGILGVITLILFTAPVGIEAFSVYIPQIYWKIAVAALILTALGLAITLLLNWYYKPASQPVYPASAHDSSPYPTEPSPGVQPQSVEPVGSETTTGLLPWPTFADGTPYPQLPNGQPDFSVVQK
ncbi:MAG TPA: hypothetical protein VLZ31_06825 [Microbacteriaceae bacterium]|nr:hypothetical protein [Microbacteriaceae bacterium]